MMKTMPNRKVDDGPLDRGQLTGPYKRASEWLVQSFRVNGYRGSSAWQSRFFHPIRGWSHPYPETTGYIIPTLYDYFKWLKDENGEIKTCIETSIPWLLSLQMRSGAFPGGHAAQNGAFYLGTLDYILHRAHAPKESVFNTAQIMRGLIRCYNETGNSDCLNAVKKSGEFLSSSIREDGGWGNDAYAKDLSPSYFAYIIPALLAAAELINDKDLKAKALLPLDNLLKRIDGESRFIRDMGFSDNGFAHMHTVGYTLQGLLESAIILKDEGGRYISEAAGVADKLLAKYEEWGKLPGGLYNGWRPEWSYSCITGNCQIALFFLELFKVNKEVRYLDAAQSIYSDMLTAQSRNNAFPGSRPVWGRYMCLRWPNWAVKFFMDLSFGLYNALRDKQG
ncbi:MAG: hypothetical protein HQ558_02040 [Candidatus Omnitrophica bacterium]|nr:hypothetical protein [Candidatus Omnitrophota bacterium]